MKKIAVITSTRAEYGLLSPIIKKMRKQETDSFKVDLIVTGTHLCRDFGMTVDEIDDRIDFTVSIPVKTERAEDISSNQAEALREFAKLFSEQSYNAVVILGDRYEMLAVAIAAGNNGTPIIHLCGGDTTEGAIDEWVRHSITKMSYYHFPTNEISKRRIIQMGESPERVFNFGSTSIDNIMQLDYLSKKEALNSVGLNDCRYALGTYHPVTLDTSKIEQQLEELLAAIEAYSSIEFILTGSNADKDGEKINSILEQASRRISNLHLFSSLGTKRYLSLMKWSEFVIGNSSSGIVEAPALHIPTVNIGSRQKGRLQSAGIINCECQREAITTAIGIALSDEHVRLCKSVNSPYGKGDAGELIANRIIEIVSGGLIDLKKTFYSLEN